MTDAALTFDHASKVYAGRTVLDDAVLSIALGETLALVGHNGAGKTTMIKLLLGLIRPTSGAVRVLGLDPAGEDGAEAKRALGFLPETVAFQQAMTGIEALNFFARLKAADLTKNMALLERVGLEDAAKRRVKTYSKGMRQRLGLAQALLGNPRLMLLDEPTSGLDPATRRQFYDTISALRDDGVTVLLSSHALSEFESHVDRIAIMNAGRLRASGTLAELRDDADIPVRIRLRTRDGVAADIANRLDGIDVTRVNGRMVELSCTPEDKMTLVRRITDMGASIEDMEIDLPSLDQLYRHYRNADEVS
ncbi:MAG: ABC transporter ATP-binding protein [Alphaproteobacteria bacterium]